MWVTEIGFGPHADHKQHRRSSSSTVLEVISTVWAVARILNTHLGMGIRGTRVVSSHFSTQLRRAQT